MQYAYLWILLQYATDKVNECQYFSVIMNGESYYDSGFSTAIAQKYTKNHFGMFSTISVARLYYTERQTANQNK